MTNSTWCGVARVVALIAVAMLLGFASARAADAILSGTIKSSAGEEMGGVTVSAKAQAPPSPPRCSPRAGNYYFPPLPAGNTGSGRRRCPSRPPRARSISAPRRSRTSRSRPMEDFFRQLPGNVMLAALPEDDAARQAHEAHRAQQLHRLPHPSYVLQHRFDEAGWNAIIELMKNVNVYGIYRRRERPPSGILDYHQKELAAYLAGPRPRRKRHEGQARAAPVRRSGARRVQGIRRAARSGRRPAGEFRAERRQRLVARHAVGADPGLGRARRLARSRRQSLVHLQHPEQAHHDRPDRHQDRRGQAVQGRRRRNGLAAQTHGMTRDANGIIWFNVNPGRGGLGRLDPKTEKIDVFIPPTGMSPTGGATTVDYDGKGRIWSSSPDGALRFDPDDRKVHRVQVDHLQDAERHRRHLRRRRRPRRQRLVGRDDARHHRQGRRRDRQGRGGQARAGQGRARPRHARRTRKFYETYNQPDFNSPMPWAQGPRRMGTDKNDDVLWVGNSWGANLARINTTHPRDDLRAAARPAAALSRARSTSNHNAWTNLWGADRVMRYDPASRCLDGVRSADARRRAALHLAARARRRADAGGAAVFPRPQGRGHDAAQRAGVSRR